jgi:hypothetical protein
MRKALAAKAGFALTLAAATSALSSVPVAAADGGPPQGGGGCHMLTASSTGLTEMMAGSANGNGAANMLEMLARFSTKPFCGA